MTGWAGRPGFSWYIEKPTTAAMALRAACSGIINTRSHTHTGGRTDDCAVSGVFTLRQVGESVDRHRRELHSFWILVLHI